jgi:hypothetical protein
VKYVLVSWWKAIWCKVTDFLSARYISGITTFNIWRVEINNNKKTAIYMYCLYVLCIYTSLAYNVYANSKCRSDWKSCVQKINKKFRVTEIVARPWRACMNKRYNLVIKAQEPHRCNYCLRIISQKTSCITLVSPHLFELIAYCIMCGFKCRGHIEMCLVWWPGLMWTTDLRQFYYATVSSSTNHEAFSVIDEIVTFFLYTYFGIILCFPDRILILVVTKTN